MDPRRDMIERQLRERGIADERLLRAMAELPREPFVPDEQAALAYADAPLPIGEAQTISQPYVVAKMVELAEIGADDVVLDVGAGSGYQTAVLAALARRVYGVELVPELAERARGVLASRGIDNAEVAAGDGNAGRTEHAPYDAILMAAAAEAVPPALFEQLGDGGRLLAPVGPREGQELIRYRKWGRQLVEERFGSVRFIPFVRDSEAMTRREE